MLPAMDESTGLRILSLAGITISTALAYLRHTHRAGAYCPQCQRWADLNLAQLARRGLADQPLASQPLRCRDCRTRGSPTYSHRR